MDNTLVFKDTWTAIANRALNILGRDALESINDTESRDALLSREALGETVETVSGEWNWTFLREYATLIPDSVATGPYTYSYSLPPLCMRLEKIDTSGVKFLLTNGKIHTDSRSISIVYEKRPDEPLNFPPLFKEALTHHLAFSIAKSLTGNDNLKATEYQLYLEALEKAKTADRAWLESASTPWWTEEIGE